MIICVKVIVGHAFNSLVFLSRQWIAELYWQLCVKYFEVLPPCFPKWLYHFINPLALYEDTNFSTSLFALYLLFFNVNPPSGCQTVYPYG